MDPTANLVELRELIAEYRAREEKANRELVAPQHQAEDFDRIMELFEALDEWIMKGGFLPEDWARERKFSYYPCENCVKAAPECPLEPIGPAPETPGEVWGCSSHQAIPGKGAGEVLANAAIEVLMGSLDVVISRFKQMDAVPAVKTMLEEAEADRKLAGRLVSRKDRGDRR